MKPITLFAFLFVSILTSAQNNTFNENILSSDTVYIDSLGIEQPCKTKGAIKYKFTSIDPDDQNIRIFYEYYMSGQISEKKTYRLEPDKTKYDGFKKVQVGDHCMWHTNGVPKLQVHYNNGKIDGTLTTFWKNGKIRREDIYKNGDIQKGRCLNPLGEPTAYYPYVVYPEFPGGEYRLSRYMETHILYPDKAEMESTEGKVVVLFTIDPTGEVQNIKLTQPSTEELNNEVIHFLKKMPKWHPGRIENEPASFGYYFLTIKFRMVE